MTEDTDTTQETLDDDEEPADDNIDDERAAVATDEDGSADGQQGRVADANVRAYLLKGALVMLVVLGVVATLQFYLSAQTAIRRLASDEFRPVFVAAFNLVVLLSVGVGIAQVVRRIG